MAGPVSEGIAIDLTVDVPRLGELLLRFGLLSGAHHVTNALSRQASSGGRLGSHLVALGALSADRLAMALGVQHHVQPAEESLLQRVSAAAVSALPREVCESYRVLPLRVDGETLHLAMVDPQRLELVDEIGRRVGMPIVRPYALPEICFTRYLERHYGGRVLHLPPPPRGPQLARARESDFEIVVSFEESDLELVRAESFAESDPVTGPKPLLQPEPLTGPVAAAGPDGQPVTRLLRNPAEAAKVDSAVLTGLLEDKTTARAPLTPSRSGAGEITLLPPSHRAFGRYTLICRLASGGMANLFLAKLIGPDGFQKLAAIKQVHEHLSYDREFIQMFIDEARLAARISHPNVVQVIELGRAGDAYFMAMEYVAGETLAALLGRTGVPFPVCARIASNAAAGLHAAHELQDSAGECLHVVHRDMTPQNILLAYDGAVKVVDFGIARARSNLHTSEGRTIKGKCAYLAPEQIRGQPVDRRTDLFSLGVVLYEASLRRRLFRAPTESESMARILHGEIRSPSSVLPHYPRRLERIVMKALERDPRRRFQTAEEMQLALEEYIMEAGSPLPNAGLSGLMKATFSDQIKKKQAVLREDEEGG